MIAVLASLIFFAAVVGFAAGGMVESAMEERQTKESELREVEYERSKERADQQRRLEGLCREVEAVNQEIRALRQEARVRG